MEEENRTEERRGLLTDLGIFALIVGLGLAAIYFSGNWPWFLKMVANLEAEAKDFANIFISNIQSVTDVAKNAPQL